MTETTSRCAACGVALSSPDAICASCDAALIEAFPKPFRCPVCEAAFSEAKLFPYPLEKPWYWPKKLLPRCPECQAWLRDQSRLPRDDWRVLGFVAAVLLVAVLPMAIWLKVGSIVLLQLILAFQERRYARQIPESRRYTQYTGPAG